MLKFKIAQKSDIPSLSSLLTLLFSQENEFSPDEKLQIDGLSLIIENPKIGYIYVLKNEDKVIGMVSILNSISTALGRPVGILEDMVIHPDFRGEGHGKKLIQFAIDHATKKGLKRITLLTDYDNERAIGFYKKMGFSKMAMIPLRKFT